MHTLLLISNALLWLVVIVLAGAVLALARQVGLIHARVPAFGARTLSAGPKIGSPAPIFSAPGGDGGIVHLGQPMDRPTLVFFMSPDCSTCAQVAPAVRSVARSEADLRVVLVARADERGAGDFMRKHGLTSVPFVLSSELTDLYEVQSTPYGIAIDGMGVVRAKGVVNNIEHIESLITALEAGADDDPHVRVGG